MPLYIDIHENIPGLTAELAAAAHERDLAVQDRHGVQYRQYWFDEASGKVFCLVDAPSAELATAVHVEANGAPADSITRVQAGD
jgi:hypothetical protein